MRRRGHGFRMLGMEGNISCGDPKKGDGVCGVGVMVKEELCENVAYWRRLI